MDDHRKKRDPQAWLKVAGVVFAVYLTSFGVVLWMDGSGMISRPPPAFVSLFYAPLIAFSSLVSMLLK